MNMKRKIILTEREQLSLLNHINENGIGISFGTGTVGAGHSAPGAFSGFVKYEILPLDSGKYLEMRNPGILDYESHVNKGDRVIGVCLDDNKQHSGTVHRVIKDGDAEIQWVVILDDRWKEFIRLDPDTIVLSGYNVQHDNDDEDYEEYRV